VEQLRPSFALLQEKVENVHMWELRSATKSAVSRVIGTLQLVDGRRCRWRYVGGNYRTGDFFEPRVEPRGLAAQITFANYGQRQAILHEVARQLDVRRFYGSRRDFRKGRVAFYFVPMRRDLWKLIRVARKSRVFANIRTMLQWGGFAAG